MLLIKYYFYISKYILTQVYQNRPKKVKHEKVPLNIYWLESNKKRTQKKRILNLFLLKELNLLIASKTINRGIKYNV